MRSPLTRRFVLFVATAAVAPLLIYGLLSIGSLWRGTRESVRAGNLNVATRAASQIDQYLANAFKVLRSLGADLRQTRLAAWQQDRILKNYVLDFPEFRELTLFGADGSVVTSRLGSPAVRPPAASAVRPEGLFVSPLSVDDDYLPTTTVAVRLDEPGGGTSWLVGALSLEELWRMVDSIRIGARGFAMLVSDDDRLVAHGDPDEKRQIAQGEGAPDPPLQELVRDARTPYREYRDRRGREVLAVAARVETLRWTLIVEQPAEEAYAVAIRLQRQLWVMIGLALLVTIAAGSLWSRSVINRIFILMRGTQAIAEGRMQERVAVPGRDEIRQLGDAFNTMADRLVELQENVRRQERQAMFGRLAAGLVHDLAHPIQNIGNSCKLIMRMWDDLEYRDTFKRTVDRELGVIRQMLDDLRHIAKPATLRKFPMDANRTVAEVVESTRPEAEAAGVTLSGQLWPTPLLIEGEPFALGRVCRNLIVNAIQATERGGLVVAETELVGDRVQVRVYDTGCGIPPERLRTIFDDFVTTKQRGLGLGLAISRRIVEQLGGSVTVSSELGKGTTFVLDFPATDARTMPTAVVAG